MRKAIGPLSVLSLSAVLGCGSISKTFTAPAVSKSISPEFNRYHGPYGPPNVLFIGDSVTAAWLTPAVLAQNPTWHVAPVPTDTQSQADAPHYTTVDLLNGMPAALDSCKQCTVVEILAGTDDYILSQNEFIEVPCPNIQPSGGDAEFPPSLQTTCQNIQSMVTAAQNQCKAVVVGTIPPLGPTFTNPQVNEEIDDSALYLYGDVDGLNSTILYAYGNGGKQGVLPGGGPVVAAVDYHAVLANQPGPLESYTPAYTDDGINPNAAGGQLMVQQLNAVLKQMGEEQPLPFVRR
jgi:hypothetical protein